MAQDDEAAEPLGPDGCSLPAPQRMTLRRARSWIKREQVALGVWPCGSAIEWVPADERAAFAVRLRRAEGKDCNLDGDALLFTITAERHAIVLDER